MTRDHRATRVAVRGQAAQIDRKIAPLVRAIWKLGIETHCSCEAWSAGSRHPRKPWVQVGFPAADEASAFMSAAAGDTAGLYDRMHDVWRVEISMLDRNWDDDALARVGPADFDHVVFIYFPRSDVRQ